MLKNMIFGAELVYTSKFSVYGTVLSLKTNSSKISNEIFNDLKDYEVKIAKNDCELELIESKGKPPINIPEYAIRETFIPPNKETYITSDFRFLKEKNKYIIKVDLKRDRIFGYFKPSNKSLWFARFLVKWMLIKALENKNILSIHGSGVTDDTVTSVFLGPSGFGKTSILIALLQEGYRMVSDDTTLIKNGYILPFYFRSTIHNNTLKRFPVLRKKSNEISVCIPRQVWLIDLGKIFPVEKKKVKPSNLFFTYVWNSAETKIEEIPKKEMLSRLLYCYLDEYKNSIWFGLNKSEEMGKNFQIYSSLVKNVNCYKILAGRNLSGFLSKIRDIEAGCR